MLRFFTGLLVGMAAASAALVGAQQLLRAPIVFSAADHASAPAWIQRGFERYRWSRVEVSRDDRGRIAGHCTAWSTAATPSSAGDLVTLPDGQLAKDGTWLYYDEEANLVQIELFTSGTIDEALTIAGDGRIELFRYVQGALHQRVDYQPMVASTSR